MRDRRRVQVAPASALRPVSTMMATPVAMTAAAIQPPIRRPRPMTSSPMILGAADTRSIIASTGTAMTPLRTAL
jgi:hypothetical protein